MGSRVSCFWSTSLRTPATIFSCVWLDRQAAEGGKKNSAVEPVKIVPCSQTTIHPPPLSGIIAMIRRAQSTRATGYPPLTDLLGDGVGAVDERGNQRRQAHRREQDRHSNPNRRNLWGGGLIFGGEGQRGAGERRSSKHPLISLPHPFLSMTPPPSFRLSLVRVT